MEDEVTIVKSQTLRLSAAPSITEDPTIILVGEGLPEYEGRTPRMGLAVRIVPPRRDGGLEGEMDLHNSSFSVKDLVGRGNRRRGPAHRGRKFCTPSFAVER